MNIGKLLKGAVRLIKKNPEIALAVTGVIAPGLARKVVPIVVAVATAKEENES